MKMKRFFAGLIVLCMAVVFMGAAFAETTDVQVRVASLKGPTTMGLVKLINDNENGLTQNSYTFQIEGTADAITPALLRGELDIAMVPCNLAAVLINKSEGALQIAAVNTLGVLYVLENGESIQSVADLKGKTIYSTGQGTTPEYALNYILAGNGLDPETDVNIEFKSEATEVASAMLADQAAIAVLPQPYVTGVLAQNENVRVALSLTEEWDKIGGGSAMITGVALVRKDFIENNADAFKAFLEEYAASTAYVNDNPEEAGEWIAELGITASAAVATKAIPACNIVCITGNEMVEKVSGYLSALYEQDPQSVGGVLPDETYFYVVS